MTEVSLGTSRYGRVAGFAGGRRADTVPIKIINKTIAFPYELKIQCRGGDEDARSRQMSDHRRFGRGYRDDATVADESPQDFGSHQSSRSDRHADQYGAYGRKVDERRDDASTHAFLAPIIPRTCETSSSGRVMTRHPTQNPKCRMKGTRLHGCAFPPFPAHPSSLFRGELCPRPSDVGDPVDQRAMASRCACDSSIQCLSQCPFRRSREKCESLLWEA